MTTYLKSLLAGAALAAIAVPAQAQMSTVTASDIIVRSGPGEEYPEVGLATRGSQALMDGCLEGSNWCRIDVNGMRGWVFAEYLTIEQDGAPIVVEEYRTQYDVPTLTYETAGGAVSPAASDLLLGPVEEVTVVEPPETVYTYIEQHRPEPVRVQNEVVVGAALPPGVVVQQVPDYEYDYVVVNESPVLVDPQTRRIVYVYD